SSPSCALSPCSATFTISKRTPTGIVTLASFGYPFHDGTVMQMAARGSLIMVWIDAYYGTFTDSELTGGGVGLNAAGSYFNDGGGEGLTDIRLGPIDQTAPVQVRLSSVRTSSFSKRVDLQWAATADDSGGIGLVGYQVFRNDGGGDVLLGTTSAT